MLLTPGQTWAADGPNPVVSATLAHAEAMQNRMVLIDPPAALELADATVVDAMAPPTSTYSVMYYPWVRVANPFFNEDTNPTAAKTVRVAPSAFAAGIWTKIDGRRGVWKAPAGIETRLIGAAGLEYAVEDGEQGQLNPLGVNAYRKIPTFGPVIWGARTLSTKANPEWRYVPVRRTAIFIEQSIYNAIQWAVFEPNDHPLWSSLRANIGGFMNGLFRAGAFQGKTADDAYFVRCGLGDTMTQADIDRGQVIVLVAFAPLKPAEFVIVRIQQKVGQQ
jgi:phage tail sheath protein FI